MMLILQSSAQNVDVRPKSVDTIAKLTILKRDASQVLTQPEYPFFDIDDDRIFYTLSLSATQHLEHTSFLYLEIKKKTNIQYKLKPLYTKKIELSALNNLQYTDSILLNQARLASGNFDIILTLMNDSSKVLHIKKAGFQLLRSSNEKIKDEYFELESNAAANIVKLENTFVSKYDIETIKRNINSLKPIAQGIEVKVIRDLADMQDLQFLRQFFFNFWYNRNATYPEEEWKKYADKLNAVAKLYGTATQPGYETDRGRIYITYGEPQKIEKVPSEKDALPYEIWFYKYIENRSNISFLFFQPGRVGSQMFLLHSNYDGEVRNPYWKETLLMDPANGDNKLMHRVFEYFK